MITEIDRAACAEISAAAITALQEVATRYGLAVRLDGGRFSPDRYNMKVEFAPMTVTATSDATAIPASFAADAVKLGLSADCFGGEFTSETGERYRITGIKRRNRKYPVIALRLKDSKSFKLPVYTVQRGLRNEVAA
jgi:hypothetical protein